MGTAALPECSHHPAGKFTEAPRSFIVALGKAGHGRDEQEPGDPAEQSLQPDGDLRCPGEHAI